MHFSSGINCPPYESADRYLQTTEGCSHNHCLFCTYFKDKKFKKSPIEQIEADIKEIPQYFGAPKRIFLQGADGFAADYDVLMKTAELLHKYVPSVETIGGYARIDNFYDKTEEQLNEHASNLFHVQCRLPEAKEELLAYIQKFMENSDEKELRQYRERVTRAFR